MNTKTKSVEVLPLVKYYIDELKLPQMFDKYIPNTNRAQIPASQVLSLMIMNIVTSSKPLYRVEDWLHDYLDGITEASINSAKYNDDRLGRNLDYLFDADRASLLAELSAHAISLHKLETHEIHNDSTSITFMGAYENENHSAAQITYGYNKDHRPDCKQLVFGLNITADGHVPLSYEVYDGNQADVSTHTSNWENLRKLLNTETFIYIADSKLCSVANLTTIDENGGLFITVVPRNFSEIKAFLNRVSEGEEIDWHYQYQTPDSRKKDRTQDYQIHEGEQMTNGYRILWIHSQAKEKLECKAREKRIIKAEQALERLSSGLNRYKLKTREQIEKAVKKACKGASCYLSVTLEEEISIDRVPVGRGKPGPSTRYTNKEVISYQLKWTRNEQEVSQAQRTDGLFPLADNTDLEPVKVLQTYKDQPYLEKRFCTKKSVLEIAPVFLKNPERIEAMVCLYFIALMIVSLIERRIRKEMQEQKIVSLPMRPAGMHTKKPTWQTIVDSFHGVHLAMIEESGQVIHTALKGLNALRRQILELLKVPVTIYAKLLDRWWEFAT